MSLYAILEAIRASGDSEVQKIEAQAYVQCNQILANTRLEAEQVKIDAQRKATAMAFKERARLIQRARLEALQILGDAREEFIQAALSQIHTQLANTRIGENYPQILQRLLEEALAEHKVSLTNPSMIQLEADPRDQAVLDSVLLDLGLELSVSYGLVCLGGLNARSQDGRVVVINTIEARLERATPYLRRYLSALFENQELEGEMFPVADKQFASI